MTDDVATKQTLTPDPASIGNQVLLAGALPDPVILGGSLTSIVLSGATRGEAWRGRVKPPEELDAAKVDQTT